MDATTSRWANANTYILPPPNQFTKDAKMALNATTLSKENANITIPPNLSLLAVVPSSALAVISPPSCNSQANPAKYA
jgi:hypothetical protein